MIFMDRNKEAKKKMDNYLMHDLGLAKHMLTIKEDENGNKTIEKYYPKLKALT